MSDIYIYVSLCAYLYTGDVHDDSKGREVVTLTHSRPFGPVLDMSGPAALGGPLAHTVRPCLPEGTLRVGPVREVGPPQVEQDGGLEVARHGRVTVHQVQGEDGGIHLQRDARLTPGEVENEILKSCM